MFFKGLPIPVQAIMTVGFYLSFRNDEVIFFRFSVRDEQRTDSHGYHLVPFDGQYRTLR